VILEKLRPKQRQGTLRDIEGIFNLLVKQNLNASKLENQTFCVLSNGTPKIEILRKFAMLRDSQTSSSRSINAKAHVCQVLAFEPRYAVIMTYSLAALNLVIRYVAGRSHITELFLVRV
jgi:hypothetical protein